MEGTGCGGRWGQATSPPFPHATSGHSCCSGLLVDTSPFHSQKRPSLGSKILWAPQVQVSVSSFSTWGNWGSLQLRLVAPGPGVRRGQSWDGNGSCLTSKPRLFRSPVLPSSTFWNTPGCHIPRALAFLSRGLGPSRLHHVLASLLETVSLTCKGGVVIAPLLTSEGCWVSQMTPGLQRIRYRCDGRVTATNAFLPQA